MFLFSILAALFGLLFGMTDAEAGDGDPDAADAGGGAPGGDGDAADGSDDDPVAALKAAHGAVVADMQGKLDATLSALRSTIAEQHGLDASRAEVLLTGSDAAALVAQAKALQELRTTKIPITRDAKTPPAGSTGQPNTDKDADDKPRSAVAALRALARG